MIRRIDSKTTVAILAMIGFVSVGMFYFKNPRISWVWLWQWALLLGYIFAYQRIFRRFTFEGKLSPIKLVFSTLLAAGWMYSSHDKPFHAYGAVMWLATLLTLWLFSTTFYFLLTWLERPFPSHVERPVWWALLYGLIPGAVWFVYFLAYDPGKMTFDSFWQWDMAHHIMPYNAWHPVLHTWMIQATTWLWPSPASYSIVQIIMVSAIVAYAMYTLQTAGIPLPWVVGIDIFYAINPVTGFYAVTMWKDIPFSAMVLLTTTLLTKILLTHGEWLKNKKNLAAFILVCFITMNLRDNGPEVIIAVLVFALILLRGLRVRMVGATGSVLVLYYLFTGPLMSALHVIHNPINQALAIPSQQIAATYHYDGKFTPQLRQYFDHILPANRWSKDYHPYTVNPVKHDARYNQAIVSKNMPLYLENWAKLLMLNPDIFVSAYLHQVSPIWQFQTPASLHPLFTEEANLQYYPLNIELNAPGKRLGESNSQFWQDAYQHYVQQMKVASPKLPIKTFTQYQVAARETVAPLRTHSVLPFMETFFTMGYKGINHFFQDYFLKGAIPLFLLLLSFVAAIRRFGVRGTIIYLPALFVIVTIAMGMPASDFRYSYSFVFSVPFLFFLSKVPIQGRQDNLGESRHNSVGGAS